MKRLRALRDSVRSGFWAVPALCVVLAVGLANILVAVDRHLQQGFGGDWTFGAGPDGAREVLSAISTSMITFTGLVFSITIVVLQLTSSQYSPRVLRTFLRDRLTQAALGVFVATFVYAVLVLRTVRSTTDDPFVPAVSTTVGVALLLASVGMFVAYIHHVATMIQVTSILSRIGVGSRAALERRYPPGREDAPPGRVPVGTPRAVLPARRSGVVVAVDDGALVEAAAAADVVLRVPVHLGAYVPEGAPLVEVHGDPQRLDAERVLAAVRIERDRTLEQDVAFGFRQLVDIADRALSPGINDPTTAVQALDELHDLLRRLATRPLRSGRYVDDDGRTRLITQPERLSDYLALALDEVEQYGADSLQVQQRVRRLLDDVEAAALPEHRAAVVARRTR